MVIQNEPLPKPFEADIYRKNVPDVGGKTDQELKSHYLEVGLNEGVTANRLTSRSNFIALVPMDSDSLEIGPFCNPLLRGPNVHYFDVMNKEGLERRAEEIGYVYKTAPEIDYVSPIGDLGIINKKFQSVLSSHCIEHQPDFIAHLQNVSRILRSAGRYYMLVPDKRYCFDALLNESSIADVLEAHFAGRRVHQLKSVIEHRALTTHNDPKRHWDGDHGSLVGNEDRIRAAIEQYKKAKGAYIDVHAWCFTPSSADVMFSHLRRLKYIDLDLEVVYPTRRNRNEFWVVLSKTS